MLKPLLPAEQPRARVQLIAATLEPELLQRKDLLTKHQSCS